MLLNARKTNGTGDAVVISHDGRNGCNPRLIRAAGVFDGATITFEHSFDDGATWDPATAISFTAPGVKTIYLVPFQRLRAKVADGAESADQSISCDYI